MIESIIILSLILINGVFALSEMSLVSAKRLRLEQLAGEGSIGAKRAVALMERPNRFLSTVQIGITLIGVLAGAFGGNALSKPLARVLEGVSFLAPYAQSVSFTLVVILITYFSLVLGELVPKRIALSNPERFATLTSGLMTFISRIAHPFVLFLSSSMNLVLRLLGINPKQVEEITEEEIAIMLEQATQAGVFKEAEQDIVENVFLLGDRRVNAIMTPRRDIVWLNSHSSSEELLEQVRKQPHSRYIVSGGDLDKVLGTLPVKDLLSANLENRSELKKLLKTPVYVPETTEALTLLETFKQSRAHILIVVDEYGSVEGMVTPTDVLEALVGNLPDRGEAVPNTYQREDSSWIIDGLMTLDAFQQRFGLPTLPEGARRDYQTVGGFALAQIGQIPKQGERFHWEGLSFEIASMEGSRVDKLILMQPETKKQTREDS